jgi:hypothetical protein
MCGISGSKRPREPEAIDRFDLKAGAFDGGGGVAGGVTAAAILGHRPLWSAICSSARLGWQLGMTCS